MVSDLSGNTDTCTFNILVRDAIAPQITNCPTNSLRFNTIPDSCYARVHLPTLNYSDNCDPAPLLQINHSSGIYSPGSYSVQATVTDSSGNVSTPCLFNVLVIDNQAPDLIFCQDTSITIYLPSDTCEAVACWPSAVFIDNCALMRVDSTHIPCDSYEADSFWVTYTAWDSSFNNRSCSFQVFVKDTSPPELLNCPVDTLVLETDPGLCTRVGGWVPPGIKDNCAPRNDLTSDYSIVDALAVGTYTNTYVARDPGGNTDSCSFLIQVVDREPPQIHNCPPPGTRIIQYAGQFCDQIVKLPKFSWTDNCGMSPDSLWSKCGSALSPYLGDSTVDFPFGICLVQVWVSDLSGNMDSCFFEVEIRDTIPPHIIVLPENDTLYLPENNCEAIFLDDFVQPSDNCPGVDISCFPQSPSYPLGQHTITCTAKDRAGNTFSQSYIITVLDTISPRILNCPDSIVAYCEWDTCGVRVNWDQLQVVDNCLPLKDSSWNWASGGFFPIGKHEVQFDGRDSANNAVNCYFEVTVLDTTVPEITACENHEVIAYIPGCRALNPGIEVEDNCGPLTISYLPNTVSFPEGIHEIKATVTDPSGNKDSCTYTLSVIRSINPGIRNGDTLICRGAEIQLEAYGASSYRWRPAIALSNVNIASPLASPRSDITYIVESTDGICNFEDSVRVDVYAAFDTRAFSNDYDVCEGEIIHLYAAGGTRFVWFTTGDTAQEIFQYPTQTTTYEVMGYGPNFVCDGDTAYVSVEVFPYPEIEVEANPHRGQSPLTVHFENNTTFAHSYIWRWYPNMVMERPSFKHTFYELGKTHITIEAIGENNCRSYDTVEIEVIPLCWVFPNAFTPNSDGYNDEYTLNVCEFRSFQFAIYSRWGQQVYEFYGTTSEVNWDGRFKGESAPEGIYTAYVKAQDLTGYWHETSFNITLIR